MLTPSNTGLPDTQLGAGALPRDVFRPLQDLSLLERKRQLDPDAYARFLRAKGPIFFWPKGGFFVVSSFDLARQALRNPSLSCDRSTFFISRMPEMDLSLITDFFGVIKNMMVMSDAPEHARRRGVASRGFDGDLLESYRPLVQRTVNELLSPLREEGRCEFVSEVAMQLPATILADLFQIPLEIRADFYRWSGCMTRFFGGASEYKNRDGVAVNDAAIHIRNLFEHLMTERKARPNSDFLSIMLRFQAKLGLTDAEVISQAVMMLVAGTITTTDQLCNNLFTLLSEPGLWNQLNKNSGLLPTAIEELNRWDPGVSYLFRVARSQTRIGDALIKAGDVVFISNHAVNRDPAQFAEPHSIILDRKSNPHFAYGHGAHYCLGAPLARMQMQSLFGALISEFPGLELASDQGVARNHYSLAFSGFSALNIRNRGRD